MPITDSALPKCIVFCRICIESGEDNPTVPLQIEIHGEVFKKALVDASFCMLRHIRVFTVDFLVAKRLHLL